MVDQDFEVNALGNASVAGLTLDPVLANGIAALATAAVAQDTSQGLLVWHMWQQHMSEALHTTLQHFLAQIAMSHFEVSINSTTNLTVEHAQKSCLHCFYVCKITGSGCASTVLSMIGIYISLSALQTACLEVAVLQCPCLALKSRQHLHLTLM